MSDSSRDYDSNGSHKSFKDILQSKQGFDADSLKRGIKNTLQSMFSPKSDSSVYSKGVRELDNYGYEKYNIEDDGEIFISKVPEKALFNDGEPIMVRATGGNFVGSADNTSARYPRLTTQQNSNNYLESSLWTEAGYYFKLRELEIYYRLPEKLMESWKMEDIKIFLRGNNLFSVDSIGILDPEYISLGYPVARTFSIGFNIAF